MSQVIYSRCRRIHVIPLDVHINYNLMYNCHYLRMFLFEEKWEQLCVNDCQQVCVVPFKVLEDKSRPPSHIVPTVCLLPPVEDMTSVAMSIVVLKL